MTRSVSTYDALDKLPPECDAMFAPPASADFFGTRDWYATVIRAGLPERSRPYLLVAPHHHVLLPLQVREPGNEVSSLTTPYTCFFQPLFGPKADAASIVDAGAALAPELRRWGTVRLDALARDDAAMRALTAGLRRGGLLPVWFRNFGNWYEIVEGVDWAAYLAARDGQLRETIRRKLRRAEREHAVAFTTIRDPRETESGIDAYQSVYSRSWKEPEPFPRFNPAIMRVAAAHGVLRLGILSASDRPVAAQFWIVASGRATLLKLAHDETEKASSPGTVLTAMMIRHLMTEECVTELDFGRGDDAYKRLWAGRRRQRFGLVLANPRRPRGAAFLARHAAGIIRRVTFRI